MVFVVIPECNLRAGRERTDSDRQRDESGVYNCVVYLYEFD